jgi:hypothetical protein
MSRPWSTACLGELLTRNGEPVRLQDYDTYRLLTVRLRQRDELLLDRRPGGDSPAEGGNRVSPERTSESTR